DGKDELIVSRGVVTFEVAHDRGIDHRYLAEVHGPGRAVDRDDIALVHLDAARRAEAAPLGVDIERFGATDAGLAHSARGARRVAGLTAPAGQDAGRGDHAVEVVGVGLATDQDHRLTRARPLHRRVGVEHDPADRRARRGVEALRDLAPLT